jgi:hypothetical protein
VGPLVSVVERIRRAVICHSGASSSRTSSLEPGWFCFSFGSAADENDGIMSYRGVAVRFLGLDGIDHLGLGGALWRAWTVFRYGIHTWHHCRYAIIILYFTLPLRCVTVVLCWSFFNYELRRIWIICSRVRHYGSTTRSKSCSTVTRTRT